MWHFVFKDGSFFVFLVLNRKNKMQIFQFKIYVIFIFLFISENIIAQNYQLVSVTKVVSGNETNNALFKVTSSDPSLEYIRAQKISGPQDGVFTQNNDNIRYTSISSESGIPKNLSKIRFTFLQVDKKTPISPNSFRFIINDIDGPNNEALATNCNTNLKFLGTAKPTNLTVINMLPTIIAVGTVEENDGPTSRVMFEFKDIAVVEIDNYANDGYLKDFDMNDDYPISKPVLVKCKAYTSPIYTEKDTLSKQPIVEFRKENNKLLFNVKSIYFDRDKYDIREDAAIELEKIYQLLIKYPKIKITIGAHTDSRAPDDYNLILSENRAKSTMNWLLSKQVDASRIKGKGFGETQLVNKCVNGINCSEDEHQLNRRIEFVIDNPEVID
jgi:outer membrane protein OmpA-like peptidoglycan-associated protein